jgi:phosphoenolpyruvate carboxylase
MTGRAYLQSAKVAAAIGRQDPDGYLGMFTAAARQELEGLLNGLTPKQTTRIIRAFSYFSHLANLAEDQHHIRRTRA